VWRADDGRLNWARQIRKMVPLSRSRMHQTSQLAATEPGEKLDESK